MNSIDEELPKKESDDQSDYVYAQDSGLFTDLPKVEQADKKEEVKIEPNSFVP